MAHAFSKQTVAEFYFRRSNANLDKSGCPLFRSVEGAVTFEVRTAINPDRIVRAILQAVKETESRLPVSDVKTLTEQLDQSLIQERLVASLSSLFGVAGFASGCRRPVRPHDLTPSLGERARSAFAWRWEQHADRSPA
jgi:hypothetical protein